VVNVYPAGWYAVACTEEERRQHRCPDQRDTIRLDLKRLESLPAGE
jgi:hypothetical protein